MKLKIGQEAPGFKLPSHLDKDIRLSDYRGRNVVLAFFPLAWTPIWTEQIPSYEAEMAKFAGLDAQVLGISVDHVPCLKAWADSLGGIHYPLLSDFWPHGEVAQKYGVLRSDGKTERALFIVDKQGIIQFIDIHDIDLQPDNDELRQALRQVDPEAAAREPKRVLSPLPTGGIVMYCTKWCGDCKKAHLWLAEHKLSYTEVDIYNIEGAVKQVRQWNNGVIITPTFEIDGKIVSDFDEPKLREVLKEKL